MTQPDGKGQPRRKGRASDMGPMWVKVDIEDRISKVRKKKVEYR